MRSILRFEVNDGKVKSDFHHVDTVPLRMEGKKNRIKFACKLFLWIGKMLRIDISIPFPIDHDKFTGKAEDICQCWVCTLNRTTERS